MLSIYYNLQYFVSLNNPPISVISVHMTINKLIIEDVPSTLVALLNVEVRFQLQVLSDRLIFD